MLESLEAFRLWLSDPVIADYVGHISYSFVALGLLLLARKNILGWVCRFIGEVGWLLIGWAINMSSLWFWGSIFLVLEVYGFQSWWRDRNKGQPKLP
jgi:hypothetical protein